MNMKEISKKQVIDNLRIFDIVLSEFIGKDAINLIAKNLDPDTREKIFGSMMNALIVGVLLYLPKDDSRIKFAEIYSNTLSDKYGKEFGDFARKGLMIAVNKDMEAFNDKSKES